MADTAPRCAVCQRPLAPQRGKLVCSAPECPLSGVDQESCCGGAPVAGPETDEACPAPKQIRWTPTD